MIVDKLKNVEVLELAKLDLATKISDCYPLPQVTWIKDEQQISPDCERIKLEALNSQHKLHIESTIEQDQGKYIFKAENELGSDETSCSATVLRKYFSLTFIITLFQLERNAF